jgi:pimeloyl-ACP methyl ester carboxylesterase
MVRVEAETRYARSGDVHIAYQVTGDGPFDLVFVPGFVTHIELAWKLATFGASLDEMASYARLIRFDKRGTGMSDLSAELQRSKRAWTTSERSWTPWARGAPRSSGFPRVPR